MFHEKEGKVYYPNEFVIIFKDPLNPIAVYPSIYTLRDGKTKIIEIEDFFKMVKRYGLLTPSTGFKYTSLSLHDAIKIYVADNLKEIFKENWSLYDIEYPLPNYERIDILAVNLDKGKYMIIEIKTSIDELDKAFGQVWRYTVSLSDSQSINIEDIERTIIISRSSIEQQINDSTIWSNFKLIDLVRLYKEVGSRTNTKFIVLDKF